MTNLVQLNFETSSIQTIVKNGEIFFRASDLTHALNFGNSRQAIATHVDEEDVQLLDTLTRGGNQKVRFVNESGMYALIFGSTKPEAKRFKKWVTAEVLPSIRKTGHYRHTISPAQQQAIRVAVAKVCKNRRTHYQTVYETLKSHFEIPRYSELLACDFEEAMALINNFSPNVTTNNSLIYNAQCLAWHAYVIASWYKAIEPHFRALSPQLSCEIHDHISHAKLFAIGINHQIGLGQMTPMLPHLETKRWAIAY